MNHVLACLCDPIADPSADDANVPVRSSTLKLIILGLCAGATGVSVALIIVCATAGTRDMSWWVALIVIGLSWTCVVLAAAGLYAQHPYYRSKIKGWFPCGRTREEDPDPFLEAGDVQLDD